MLMESFVAIMAMIAASVLQPGVYFAMNSAPAADRRDRRCRRRRRSRAGASRHARHADRRSRTSVGENSILSRTGGAPTLAVGMANILSSFLGGQALMGLWYHFAILFEALFILTTVDAGTRVARFMIQDFVGTVVPAFRQTRVLGQQSDRLGARRAAAGAISSIRASSIPTAASTRCGRCSASPTRCWRRSR